MFLTLFVVNEIKLKRWAIKMLCLKYFFNRYFVKRIVTDFCDNKDIKQIQCKYVWYESIGNVIHSRMQFVSFTMSYHKSIQ